MLKFPIKTRHLIVPIAALVSIAVAWGASRIQSWLEAEARAEWYPPAIPHPLPEPPRPELIVPSAGDCDLDFSPDGRLLAAVDTKNQGAGQGAVRVYGIADHQTVANLGIGADCCAWSPDGTLLGVARTGPARLELWNTTTWTLSDTVAVPDVDGEGSRGSVIFGGLCFDQIQNVFVVARVESSTFKQRCSHAFVWWNLSGVRSRQLETIGSYPKAEAFSLSVSSGTGSETVLAISYVCAQHAADKKDVPLEVLRIWYEGGRRIIRQGEILPLTHETWVRVSPDGKTLAALTGPDGFHEWGLFKLGTNFNGSWSLSDSNNRAPDLDEMRFQKVDFSAASRLAILTVADKFERRSPQVFDLASDKKDSFWPQIPGDDSTAVALSPDGHLLAVSTPGKGIFVYRLP
jgi:WD40 repeat protein